MEATIAVGHDTGSTCNRYGNPLGSRAIRDGLGGFSDETAYVARFTPQVKMAGRPRADVDQPFSEQSKPTRFIDDDFDRSRSTGFIQMRALQTLGESNDRGERRAQLVRDGSQHGGAPLFNARNDGCASHGLAKRSKRRLSVEFEDGPSAAYGMPLLPDGRGTPYPTPHGGKRALDGPAKSLRRHPEICVRDERLAAPCSRDKQSDEPLRPGASCGEIFLPKHGPQRCFQGCGDGLLVLRLQLASRGSLRALCVGKLDVEQRDRGAGARKRREPTSNVAEVRQTRREIAPVRYFGAVNL